MAKGILYVETYPSSPERAEEYHKWYNEVHLPEICSIEGFVSASRYAPVDGEGPFVAIYELEGDDLQAVQARLGEAAGSGKMTMSDVLALDPPPVMRLLELTSSHEPAAASS
jgi:hypothetical protein